MPEAQEHSVTDAVVTHASTQVDVRVLENQPSNTIEGIVNERVDEKAEITRSVFHDPHLILCGN